MRRKNIQIHSFMFLGPQLVLVSYMVFDAGIADIKGVILRVKSTMQQ